VEVRKQTFGKLTNNWKTLLYNYFFLSKITFIRKQTKQILHNNGFLVMVKNNKINITKFFLILFNRARVIPENFKFDNI